MVHLEDIAQEGLPRLLEVDNRLVLPYKTDIRVITYSKILTWHLPNARLPLLPALV